MNPIRLQPETATHVRAASRAESSLPREFVQLSNGHYTVHLCGTGSGVSEHADWAVSRGSPTDCLDPNGFHVYLREIASGFVWSAGYQPTRVLPQRYEFRAGPDSAEIVRTDGDVESRLSVRVAPQHDAELRCCRLANLGDRPRRIEITSYVEFVLWDPSADSGHPAFSKLFIDTRFLASANAILARRRPRGSDEPERWGVHRLLDESAAGPCDEVTFEADRARFIGRGRTLARPRALDATLGLSNTCGPVLDPVGCLRTTVSLEPGQTRSVGFLLGAASTRAEAEQLATVVSDLFHADRAFDSTSSYEGNGDDVSERSALRLTAAEGTEQMFVDPPHRLQSTAAAGLAEQTDQSTLYVPAATVPADVDPCAAGDVEPLEFDNGIGGFAAGGREYVIRVRPDGEGHLRLPPQPWSNIIANEQAGCLVTERGSGCTWVGNSRLNRLTPWHNDPVCDPHAEAFWIRDEEAGVFWSPTPGPAPAMADYEVRHGFGYTTFRHRSHDLDQETTVFVAASEPLKLTRLRLVNRGPDTRKLSVFSHLQWVLGSAPADTAESAGAVYDRQFDLIFARNPHRECRSDHVAFSAVTCDAPRDPLHVSHSVDGHAFLGLFGDREAPAAVANRSQLDGRVGNNGAPCAAWQLQIEIGPGESFECTFLLGEVADEAAASALVHRYRSRGAVEQSLAEVQAFWQDAVAAVQIETPCRELDYLVNGWLTYQNLSCRMWGRSAYYQSGGAFGFRDQLQDAAALVFVRPDLTRRQILRHAAQQFVDGDVLHWWHPDIGSGVRTRFSDDLFWLPLVVAEYVQTTGDAGVLDEVVPYITGPPLAGEQQERYFRAERADAAATVYEHCCRAVDRGLTVGAHGLPRIGCGDWNDGLSRVGRRGTGESVWLGFFIAFLLDRMVPICTQHGDQQHASRYVAYRQQLAEALNTAGWDGGWYRRAYYDDGSPLGSVESDECCIDALAQSWAILSGVAPRARQEQVARAVETHLVDKQAGLIRLLTPPFDRTPHDPGYIKAYLPGIRENGGQYTHGVLWYVRAMAKLGRGTQAVDLLRMLSPISHTATAAGMATYQTEPYVVAADVYGEPPHTGRGGWTWYTGSAGWMWRVAVESIMGLSVERGRTLVLNPTISARWPRCRLSYRLPESSTRYEIVIENPDGKETGVTSATVDGLDAPVANGAAKLPIERDGKCHQVVVRL